MAHFLQTLDGHAHEDMPILRPARRSPLRDLSSTTDGLGTNVQSSVSPDEHVIIQRGQLRSSPRRRALATSPLVDMSKNSAIRSSPRKRAFHTSTPNSTGTLNSSLNTSTSTGPRTPTRNRNAADGIKKRLVMSPNSDTDESFPESLSPPVKRRKTTKKQAPVAPLRRRLSGLSSGQLVEMLDQLVNDHPELKTEVEGILPAPDVTPLIENLEYFRHNIYKSFPNSRWGSGRDAFCFRRVKTHIENFKGACTNQGKQLQESEAWEASIDYILSAWEVVDKLPDWDDSSHNKSKEMCFRNLTTQCKKAIKSSQFDKKTYLDIKNRLEEAVTTNREIEPCIELVNKKLQKL